MSGVAGVHGPTPKRDTDQRFTLCVAPFPGIELGWQWLCVSGVVVCVRCGRIGYFPRARVSPESMLPYDYNRRAVIAFFILFPIITFPGNQEIVLIRFRFPRNPVSRD